MTTTIRRFAGSLLFILWTTVVVNGVAIWLGRLYIGDPKDWPGWVQAIGSIEAILVAVWVSWQQSETQRQREIEKEADELKALLRAIRTEVQTSVKQARDTFGRDLDNIDTNKPYLSTLPISEDPFDIYNAALPKLGLIKEDNLRDQIVRAYAMAKGFVLTLRFHNELVAAHEHAQLQSEMNPSDAARRQLTFKAAELTGYSLVLRDFYRSMNTEVDELLQQLARY